MRLVPVSLALTLVASSSGCGGATTVQGRVVEPAAVPVRSFPRIWVVAGLMPEERRIADALSGHLATSGNANVRLVEMDELEPARRDGRIPPATVVVMMRLDTRERTRSEWGTRPETICGIAGCYTSYRSYAYEVPVLEANLEVTVYDGPTARVQQRKVVRVVEEGRDYEGLRPRAVRNLVRRVRRAVDQRAVDVEVELLSADAPNVDRAIAEIEGGDWRSGRRLLEDAVRGPRFRALPAEERARVLYNLGQARRFDSPSRREPPRHFAAAARALRAAVRLDPDDRYAQALRALEEHRRRLTVVHEQQAAAEHNYRIARPPDAPVPDPPSSYRDDDAPQDEAVPQPPSSDEGQTTTPEQDSDDADS